MTKILTLVGARPQFVKAAAFSAAVARRAGSITEIIVHTGQHFDTNMSDVFFEQMNIPRPAYHLEIHGGGHGDMTGRMMAALEPVMISEQPDIVLVYGDTNSTLAGALVASKLHVPVAHVEAGLRSFDRTMPEEINRVVTDHLSDILFPPTPLAVANLAAEGLRKNVHQVGDILYDATLMIIEAAKARSRILAELGLQRDQYVLVTLHRAAMTDTPGALKQALAFCVDEANGKRVILPVHPRTRAVIEQQNLDIDGITLIPPVGPIDMHALLEACHMVFTDSGGLQKEAYFHRKPCVTLRDSTEWLETIEFGWNRLWLGPDFVTPRVDFDSYGDGHAAEKMIDILAAYPGKTC